MQAIWAIVCPPEACRHKTYGSAYFLGYNENLLSARPPIGSLPLAAATTNLALRCNASIVWIGTEFIPADEPPLIF